MLTGWQYEASEVAVPQGFVHPGSKHVYPDLRRRVLAGQESIGARTVIADANLFLAYDPEKCKHIFKI